MLDTYEQQLLKSWEETFKKGQLSMWILLGLIDSDRHMQQIQDFILKSTNETLRADNQSIYRALRKFKAAEIVTTKITPGSRGPDHITYSLTETGSRVLAEFIHRNISSVYLNSENIKLFKKGSQYDT